MRSNLKLALQRQLARELCAQPICAVRITDTKAVSKKVLPGVLDCYELWRDKETICFVIFSVHKKLNYAYLDVGWSEGYPLVAEGEESMPLRDFMDMTNPPSRRGLIGLPPPFDTRGDTGWPMDRFLGEVQFPEWAQWLRENQPEAGCMTQQYLMAAVSPFAWEAAERDRRASNGEALPLRLDLPQEEIDSRGASLAATEISKCLLETGMPLMEQFARRES